MNKLVAYLASVDANGDGIVDEAVNFTLERAAYHANDKVVYMFATKLMNGELMDIKANYSKDAK